MNTYICKCGKMVEKSSTAASTGNRLLNYEPGHECYGCPFVLPVRDYSLPHTENIVGHECRMSRTIDYTTFAEMKLGTVLTGKIRSLDLEFLKEVRAYADTLDGMEKDRYFSTFRPTDYGADGRFTATFTVLPNKKGREAKAKLFDAFFDADGHRLDLAPQAEEDYVKQWIRDRIGEAKLDMVDISETSGPGADGQPVNEAGDEKGILDLAEESAEALMKRLEESPEDEEPEIPAEPEAENAAEEDRMQIAGRRVSIRNREFETVLCKIDDILNRALSIAIDARQGFSVTAKISLTPGTSTPSFDVSYNVGYKFDPIKVEDKGALYEAITLGFDRDGNLIIPDGSSTQITMEEITSGVTVTTDESGIVESVQTDDETDCVFPCDCTECPLHTGFTGEVSGCSFGGSITATLDDDLKGHIYDAVTEHFCTRSCINEICRREFPFSKESEAEPDPYPCGEVDCWFNKDGDVPCCELDECGGRESYMTSDFDYEDAVVTYQCTRRCVLERYKKNKGGASDE